MDVIRSMTMERDHLELSLGDTLDVKSGIVFTAIAVLGALTGTLLATAGLERELQIAQMFSLAFLAVAAFFAVMALLPRDYLLPDMPEKYRQWVAQLKDHYQGDSVAIESATADGLVKIASERIAANHDINAAKSRYLANAFWVTVAALTIDMVTLAALGVSRLLS